MNIYPLLLQPIYKDYIWGGNRIAQRYGRVGTPDICAESWEVTDRSEGMSTIINGDLKGTTLRELAETLGTDLLGTDCADSAFPLLIKLIDAKADLSVQVHPNDNNAHLTGGEPKTEMWYVLDATPGATIYAGLNPGVTQESFEASLARGDLEKSTLAKIPAKPGRAIFVPGGRVHAIGAGCLLLEIQQNSNTTYRVYDWGRVDTEGNPRELHLAQALQVVDWENAAPEVVPPQLRPSESPNQWWKIIECPYFKTARVDLHEPEDVELDGRSFHSLFVTTGTVLIGANGVMASASEGTSCLVPAAAKKYTLTPVGGRAAVVRITL